MDSLILGTQFRVLLHLKHSRSTSMFWIQPKAIDLDKLYFTSKMVNSSKALSFVHSLYINSSVTEHVHCYLPINKLFGSRYKQVVDLKMQQVRH